MKKIFTLVLTICIVNNAFAQNSTNVFIKVFSNNYAKKETSDFVKGGFGLSGSYVYKWDKQNALIGTAGFSYNKFKLNAYGTPASVITYGASAGYRRYIQKFYAQASLGYLDGSLFIEGLTNTTGPVNVPRSIGGSIGIGYDIKVSNGKAITIFTDYNLYGKKAGFSSFNVGVGFSFTSDED